MRRLIVQLLIAGSVLLLGASAVAGDKAQKRCDISFVVLKEGSDKPVKYASIVMHPVDDKGRQQKESIQLKTDGDGKTNVSGIPYGKVRVQVIASGLQTFGQDFDLAEPAKEITIKLKAPQSQYSIYK